MKLRGVAVWYDVTVLREVTVTSEGFLLSRRTKPGLPRRCCTVIGDCATDNIGIIGLLERQTKGKSVSTGEVPKRGQPESRGNSWVNFEGLANTIEAKIVALESKLLMRVNMSNFYSNQTRDLSRILR
ncbi:hypothetical protein Pla110_02290 [Polystyrenella longa]|uniref:Uncharacterized protein n=1 Tax=Polystyrenella longa TaxID=2528007 RepID=A0A518CH20_9PLAN|nr:hypothetical protein Pla110_02290 [Polystyrenella longa]